MTNKKSFVSLLLAFCLIIPVMFMFTACGSEKNPIKLSNSIGFVVEGGDFENGSVLEASAIENASENYKQVITLIAGESYDADKPVYVFEISVKKDNAKVQPNGKVKVSVPVESDLTGYDVLHIKDDGKIERLKLAYSNGIATFETDSFSKFVFVKKVTSFDMGDDKGEPDKDNTSDDKGDDKDNTSDNKGDDKDNTSDDKGESDKDDSGDGGGNETTTKYTINPFADTIIPDSSSGGAVRDKDGEYITNSSLSIAENTECTLKSHCYPNYYFLGWYKAIETEDATEENFLSSETDYTFTVTENLNILALYAYKTHAVKFMLEADGNCGFSYRDGKPTLTLVSSSDEGEKPKHKKVEVRYLKGDGTEDGYGNYNSYGFQNNVDMNIVDDNNMPVEELDYSKVGEYTITYSHKRNSKINASLQVKVVDSAHTLSVSTDTSKNLQFRYNVSGNQTSLNTVIPTGRLVTLTAETKEKYVFLGWYNGDTLMSKDIVYCFEMPDTDLTLQGYYKSEYYAKCFRFYAPSYEGELVDDFGNAYIAGDKKIYFKDNLTIKLTAREKDNYEFVGWYEIADGKSVLIETNRTINRTITENKYFDVRFREKAVSIEIDSTELAEAGFVNGQVGVVIGDDEIDYENFTLKAKDIEGYTMSLSASDYTIDGTVDFNTAGTYTITYIYKFDTSKTTQIQIVVIDPEKANFTFSHGYSYLDHEYNGKATFISLKDVRVNGITLYNFKSTSKIWEKISYKWIDKETEKEVETSDVDVTINGTVVKDYGPENYKRNIGNEFCGPIKAGLYRFELVYNGKTVVSQDSKISTQVYTKITTDDEFKTNEGSSWVNFELYYYTIIGYADGKYFVMQMPSIGLDNVEAEAREISVDSNGNAVVGDGNDFAFVYVRYFASDSSKRMEFLTGYYGSYIDYSSNSTIDGTLFGSPYIYRTGHLYISDGKICREYGNKENYGMTTKFDENGAVTIHSNSGSDNGRLRLVKDGDKYVFTSVPADTDTRESFDIFIYRTTIDTKTQNSSK